LTDDQLKSGAQHLKGVNAAGQPIAAASKEKTMFEALKPTDIVVIGTEPASVRVLDKNGEPVPLDEAGQPVPDRTSEPPTRRLCAHDDGHRDTILRVWTESDTIEYQCDRQFEIVRITRAGWKIYNAPDDPFGNSKDGYKAHKGDDEGRRGLWVWKSGLMPASANNQQYKATFKIGDNLIDPDVVCGDPPPSN